MIKKYFKIDFNLIFLNFMICSINLSASEIYKKRKSNENLHFVYEDKLRKENAENGSFSLHVW